MFISFIVIILYIAKGIKINHGDAKKNLYTIVLSDRNPNKPDRNGTVGIKKNRKDAIKRKSYIFLLKDISLSFINKKLLLKIIITIRDIIAISEKEFGKRFNQGMICICCPSFGW